MGKDHTLFALTEGNVAFGVRNIMARKKPQRFVEVVPKEILEAENLGDAFFAKLEQSLR